MAGRKTGSTGLTPLELRILRVLWAEGPARVQRVTDALDEGLAYTTVQTMLNVLCRKGHVTRRPEGRAFVYEAVATEAETTRGLLHDLLQRVFGGSAEALVMSLVSSRQLDERRLAQLTERVAKARRPDAKESKR